MKFKYLLALLLLVGCNGRNEAVMSANADISGSSMFTINER